MAVRIRGNLAVCAGDRRVYFFSFVTKLISRPVSFTSVSFRSAQKYRTLRHFWGPGRDRTGVIQGPQPGRLTHHEPFRNPARHAR